jgi:dolichol-phosphate mannosyltransferase
LDISVILPTYCESGNICLLIEAIQANLASTNWQIEIIVVDDNSPDGTAQAVQAMRPLPNVEIKCLVRTQERGLASAIRYGIQHSSGEFVLVMDTDFNHSPDNLRLMAEALDQHDLVIGSRFVRGGGMEDGLRFYCSLLFNLFIRMLLWSPVRDNLSGFFAMKRERLQTLDQGYIFRGYGEYFIRLVFFARRAGLKIQEIPVFYTLRKSGESKSHFGSMIQDYSSATIGLLGYKPRK